MIKLKRAYDPPAPQDGRRYLVDRLWPRGVKKQSLALQDWLQDLAPSHQLRKWFHRDPERWAEFQRRYEAELAEPEKQPRLRELAAQAQGGTITLVYAAKDRERNHALVLKRVLQGLLGLAAYNGPGNSLAGKKTRPGRRPNHRVNKARNL